MAIAISLAQYLADHGVKYEVVEHPQTATARESARTSHIPLKHLAKAVLLKADHGFVLAVLPASGHIRFNRIREQLGPNVDMASEEQIEALFHDCKPGAVPALGPAYGLKVIIDKTLTDEPEVYFFEGGDHASLVHVSGSTFQQLLRDARHARFAEWGRETL